MPTVYERVKSIVADKLGVDEGDVKEGSSFIEDLSADSLDLVELIMDLEDKFKGDVADEFKDDAGEFNISDEEAGNIQTIGHAVDYLKDHGVKDN